MEYTIHSRLGDAHSTHSIMGLITKLISKKFKVISLNVQSCHNTQVVMLRYEWNISLWICHNFILHPTMVHEKLYFWYKLEAKIRNIINHFQQSRVPLDIILIWLWNNRHNHDWIMTFTHNSCKMHIYNIRVHLSAVERKKMPTLIIIFVIRQKKVSELCSCSLTFRQH